MTIDEKRRQKKLAKKAANRKERKAKIKYKVDKNEDFILSALKYPIAECFAPPMLFDHGIGHLILTRTMSNDKLIMACFSLDVYCLGVKDVVYGVVTPEKFMKFFSGIEEMHRLQPIEPSCLRKIIDGAVEYAKSIGFLPHNDYIIASKLLYDIDITDCQMDFTYGREGKPYYVSTPLESVAQSNKIIAILQRTLGPDNFNYMMEIKEDPIDEDA